MSFGPAECWKCLYRLSQWGIQRLEPAWFGDDNPWMGDPDPIFNTQYCTSQDLDSATLCYRDTAPTCPTKSVWTFLFWIPTLAIRSLLLLVASSLPLKLAIHVYIFTWQDLESRAASTRRALVDLNSRGLHFDEWISIRFEADYLWIDHAYLRDHDLGHHCRGVFAPCECGDAWHCRARQKTFLG